MEPREYERLYEVEETFWWYRGLRRVIHTLMLPHLAPRSDLRILDVGCGTGGFLAELARWGRATGLDLSPRALELAARRGSFDLVRASVEDLPVAPESVDLIVSLDVLYHRGVRDDRRGLAQMVACLRPGGLLCLNLPAYEWLRSSHDAAIHTARRYTRAGVRRLLATQPLEIVRLTHWNTFLLPLALAVRRLRRNRGERDSDVRPVPRPANALFAAILAVEAYLLRRTSFPVGLSIAAVARKRRAGEARR